MANDLREQVIEWLKTHPRNFHMGDWIYRGEECGTKYCIAGLILHLSGMSDKAIATNAPREVGEDDDHDEPRIRPRLWEKRDGNDWIPNMARTIWADHYGDDMALKLPFYKFYWTLEHMIEYFETDMNPLTTLGVKEELERAGL